MPRARAHSLYIGVFLPSLPSPCAQDVDFLAVAGEGSRRICLHLSFTRLHRWGSFARACSRRWRQWRQNTSLLCSDAREGSVVGSKRGGGIDKRISTHYLRDSFFYVWGKSHYLWCKSVPVASASKRLSLSATQPLDFDFNSRPSVKVVLKSRLRGKNRRWDVYI